jgi:hypothetical protein
MWDYVTRPDKEGEVDEQKIADQLKLARDEMQVVISQER